MATMQVLPRDSEWTFEDLDALPDAGLQYELVDGVLLVTPAPVPRHQRVVVRLVVLLSAACPDELEVFVAPLDFRPTPRRSVQPDVLVTRRADVGPRNLERPPLLVVEVLSPTTRAKDALLKRAVYEDAGVPAYWLVDPDEPSLTVLELRGGRYEEAAAVRGDEQYPAQSPFRVDVVPSALARGNSS